MGLLKDWCVELRKGHLLYCCNQIWTKNGGRISWNRYCYQRNIQDKLSDGKTAYERRFGMSFEGPVIPFGSMIEYHPTHQFGPKVLPGLFIGYVPYAGRIWNGDIMVADIEELEEMDASELHASRLKCNGSVVAAKKWKLHIPSRRRNSQNRWREQRLRTSA